MPVAWQSPDPVVNDRDPPKLRGFTDHVRIQPNFVFAPLSIINFFRAMAPVIGPPWTEADIVDGKIQYGDTTFVILPEPEPGPDKDQEPK